MPEPTVPTFGWFNQAPAHLKTRNQLAALGLRPGGPVAARVVWRNGRRSADLYDQAAAKPKRTPTDAQKAAITRARQARCTCPGCGTVYEHVLPARWTVNDCGRCFELRAKEDGAAARQEAAAWLADPDAVILDTETTDLPRYIVEIAVISTSGTVLLVERSNRNQETATPPSSQGMSSMPVASACSVGNRARVVVERVVCLVVQRLVVQRDDMARGARRTPNARNPVFSSAARRTSS